MLRPLKAVLLWRAKIGSALEFLTDLSEEREELVPELEAQPPLPDFLEWLLTAFDSLSATRPVGMAPGAIPLSEMLAYCRLWDVEDAQEFVRIMIELDGEWLRDYDRRENKK